ncbi:MFS transporter [Sphingosinicella rhizophila]|uniref:MFS transporter n=1 Tax=Sphingosinicella rhizophila TaxID=3050082 RepID=A0ABU3QAA3_9SPHN|nr:MFS transporter [Sphingosinicella sp. GR2756]MDT9599923.1 MFS transporter [Sphingosinicella sp. GR2756]
MNIAGENSPVEAGHDDSVWIAVRPWYALGVLIVAIIFGFIDRQIIVLVVEPMKQELGLTDFQIGSLQGLVPALFAVVAGFPLAWLADRVDRRWLLIACILFWSAATALRGLAGGFNELLVYTVGIAVGEAVLTPIIYSLIPDLFSGRRRDFANFIFFAMTVAGVGLGMMLGGAVIGTIDSLRPLLPDGVAALSGWRLACLAVAVPGIIVALLVLPVPSGRTSLRRAAAGGEAASMSGMGAYLRRHARPFLTVNTAFGLYAFSFATLMLWLPVAMMRDMNIPASEVGVRLGTTITIAAAAGIGFAMLTASWWRRIAPGRHLLRALSSCMALAPLPLVGLLWATTPLQAYVLAGASFTFALCGTAFSPSLLQDMSPPLLRARVAAVMMITYAAAAGLGPMVTGRLSDALAPDGGSLMTIVVCLAAPCLALTSLFYRLAESPVARMTREFGTSADGMPEQNH